MKPIFATVSCALCGKALEVAAAELPRITSRLSEQGWRLEQGYCACPQCAGKLEAAKEAA